MNHHLKFGNSTPVFIISDPKKFMPLVNGFIMYMVAGKDTKLRQRLFR